ncbi:MAG: hypothetical protein M0R73_03495 [Dehalococcoidia bacterium]|nr:hypothetical protein [Dehalococcoidia bacterium]
MHLRSSLVVLSIVFLGRVLTGCDGSTSVERATPGFARLNTGFAANLAEIDDALSFSLLMPAIPDMSLPGLFAWAPSGSEQTEPSADIATLIYQEEVETVVIHQRSDTLLAEQGAIEGEVETEREIDGVPVVFAKSDDGVSRVMAFATCGTRVQAYGALEDWPVDRLADLVPYFVGSCP